MNSFFKIIDIETKGRLDITDITEEIKSLIKENNIQQGIINIQTLHTTATIFVNENEPLLLKDFKNHLQKIASIEDSYNHDNFEERTVNMCEDECANGHAHCKALHLPTNICLNINNSKLQLGSWQRIMFIELDRARKRKIQIQIIS